MTSKQEIESIKRLMRSRQPSEGIPLVCMIDRCEVNDPFRNLAAYESHMRREHPQLKVLCELCPAAVKEWNELRKHLEEDHKLKQGVDGEYVGDYLLFDVKGGFLRLYDDEDEGSLKDSVPIPRNPRLLSKIQNFFNAGYGVGLPTDEELRSQILGGYNTGHAVVVTVVTSSGGEEVKDVKKCPRNSYLFGGVDDDGLLSLLEEEGEYKERKDLLLPEDAHLRSLIESADYAEAKVEVASFNDKDVIIAVRKLKFE